MATVIVKKGADLNAEYQRAIDQGNALISKVSPVPRSEQSIADIHYWYCYAAEILIQRGEPRHKIATKLYEDFEQYYGERHIRRILKTGGIELPDENGHMSENNSSLNTFELSNSRYLELLYDVERVTISMIDACKNQEIEKQIPKDEFNHFYSLTKALITNAKNALDNRRSYHVNALHVLVMKALLSTVNDADYHYSIFIKPFIKSTAKQIRKAIMGWVPDLPLIMEPNTVDEAVYWGFSGIPCPKCIEAKRPPLRTRKEWSTDDALSIFYILKCEKCHWTSDKIKTLLYKDPNAREVVIDECGTIHGIPRVSS